jgi:hypothetical protein
VSFNKRPSKQITAEGEKEPNPVASPAILDHSGVIGKDNDGGNSPQGIELGDGTSDTGSPVRDIRPAGQPSQTGEQGRAPTTQTEFPPSRRSFKIVLACIFRFINSYTSNQKKEKTEFFHYKATKTGFIFI